MYQFRTPVGPPEPPDPLSDDEPFDEGPLKAAKAGVIHAFLVLLVVIVFIAAYIVLGA